jgi:tetratricopeptide (TPR) repeat protein
MVVLEAQLADSERYARLLRDLHQLSLEGKDDSAEAVALRDEMDALWHGLSDKEKARLAGLSEDLYSLVEGTWSPVAMTEQPRKAWSQATREAYQRCDWDRALELLRKPPDSVPSRSVRFCQARCWERLGDPETALVFMRRAAEEDSEYLVCLLALLQETGRAGEAADLAGRLLDDPKSEFEALYFASSTLLGPTQFQTDRQARPILRRLVPALQKALAMVRQIPPAQRSFAKAETAVVCLLGLCLERLGEASAAISLYDELLRRNPADADVLTFRGLARCETDWPLAQKDFEAAVNFNARFVWSYYFLAYEAILHKNYPRCLRMCERAVGRTSRREILAQLHEWAGICKAMLSHPAASIYESFEQAETFDPKNEHVGCNRSIAAALQTKAETNGSDWVIVPPVGVAATRADFISFQPAVRPVEATNILELA